jgi:hypothetical protein
MTVREIVGLDFVKRAAGSSVGLRKISNWTLRSGLPPPKWKSAHKMGAAAHRGSCTSPKHIKEWAAGAVGEKWPQEKTEQPEAESKRSPWKKMQYAHGLLGTSSLKEEWTWNVHLLLGKNRITFFYMHFHCKCNTRGKGVFYGSASILHKQYRTESNENENGVLSCQGRRVRLKIDLVIVTDCDCTGC